MVESSAITDHTFKSKLPRRHIRDNSLPKMWDMGIVLLLAHLTNNSLFVVALSGFLSSFSIFLFMPQIGKYLDYMNRMTATQICLFVKITVVSIAYLLCAFLTSGSVDSKSTLYFALLYAVPVICAIVGLSFSTITQSIEKDWIIVLSDGDSSWLSSTNSVMSQIDLSCAALAPFLTGLLFELYSITTVAFILLITNVVSTVCLFLFMRNLYWSWPQLSVRHQVEPQPVLAEAVNARDDGHNFFVCVSLRSRVKRHVADFLQSGCAGVMISYAFLFFTVLSFGSLMTVYVRWAGVSTSLIGACRGMSALTGFAGALLFPLVNSHLGLYQTAQISIVYQCLLVLVAASSFFWTSDRTFTATVVIVSVLLSRAGLWMFDLSVRQIAQETIHESVRGRVNGQWRSLTAFFDMAAYALAISIPDPNHFWILTSVSAGMVTLALLTYSWANPFCAINCCCHFHDHNGKDSLHSSSLGGGAHHSTKGSEYVRIVDTNIGDTNQFEGEFITKKMVEMHSRQVSSSQ